MDYPFAMSSMSLVQQKVLAVVPKITGLTSFVTSTFIVYTIMIKNPNLRKRSVYHRLLCGMSLADLSSSFWLSLSTWPIPETSSTLWSSGTTATCTAQGFFTQFGITSPLYNASLSFYYLLVARYGYKEQQLQKIEIWFHALPLLWGLTTSITGIFLHLFNNATLWCWIAANPDGDNRADLYRFVFFYGPLWVMVLAVTINLILVFIYVRRITLSSEQHAIQQRQEFRRISQMQQQQLVHMEPHRRDDVKDENEGEGGSTTNNDRIDGDGNNNPTSCTTSDAKEEDGVGSNDYEHGRRPQQSRTSETSQEDLKGVSPNISKIRSSLEASDDGDNVADNMPPPPAVNTITENTSRSQASSDRSNSNRRLGGNGGRSFRGGGGGGDRGVSSRRNLLMRRMSSTFQMDPAAVFAATSTTGSSSNANSATISSFARRRRQVANQCLRYAIAFYMTWVPITIVRIIQTTNATMPFNTYYALLVAAAAMTPLQGLPNFLVYWYPKYSQQWQSSISRRRSSSAHWSRRLCCCFANKHSRQDPQRHQTQNQLPQTRHQQALQQSPNESILDRNATVSAPGSSDRLRTESGTGAEGRNETAVIPSSTTVVTA